MTVSRRRALVVGCFGLGAAAVGGGYSVATHEKPEPLAPAATDAQGHLLWRNWSGVQHAYPSARIAPQSEAEVATALKTATAPIRPVGAGHSFTALAPTDGTLLSLDALSGILAWKGDEVIVAAGMRLGAFGPALAETGRAMANLPDTDKPSLAGALATGTHGTGMHLKALHGDVTALRLITPNGRLIDCDASHQPEVFQAALVSLGCLGVITQARIRTIANRRIARHVWLEPLEDALAKAEARWATHRNFEFHAVPFTGLAVGISQDETDEPALPRGPDQGAAFLEALKDLRNLLGFSTPLRKAAAQTLLAAAKPETAIDEGWRLRSFPYPRRFNAMAFHLPADVQLEALAEVIATIEKHRPDIFFPIEVRRTAPDDAWLSPFQGKPTGSIAVHTDREDEFAFLYTLIEPIFRRYEGRPHWGKLHGLSGDQLAALYPRWKDFLQVREALDPDMRMLNPYLKGLFGL